MKWNGWTDTKIAALRRDWPHKSASQIAKDLGAPSRNAIIGKAHRLGLSAKAPSRPSVHREPVRRAGRGGR